MSALVTPVKPRRIDSVSLVSILAKPPKKPPPLPSDNSTDRPRPTTKPALRDALKAAESTPSAIGKTDNTPLVAITGVELTPVSDTVSKAVSVIPSIVPFAWVTLCNVSRLRSTSPVASAMVLSLISCPVTSTPSRYTLSSRLLVGNSSFTVTSFSARPPAGVIVSTSVKGIATSSLKDNSADGKNCTAGSFGVASN